MAVQDTQRGTLLSGSCHAGMFGHIMVSICFGLMLYSPPSTLHIRSMRCWGSQCLTAQRYSRGGATVPQTVLAIDGLETSQSLSYIGLIIKCFRIRIEEVLGTSPLRDLPCVQGYFPYIYLCRNHVRKKIISVDPTIHSE